MAATSNRDDLCSICQLIPLNPSHADGRRTELGRPADIIRRQHCAICRTVYRLLPYRMTSEIRDVNRMSSKYSPEACYIVRLPPGLLVYASTEGSSFYLGMIRFQEAHVKSLPSVRLGDLVDLRILQNWLSECDSNHGETCRILTKVKRKGLIVNLILIDVVRQKLVPMSSKCRYFTLSYMWGGVKMLQATNENLSRLMQDGGISSYGSLIPPVIYDAIDLIRALGERWLWVDSLCIVSDDYTQKHDQISQMGLIYTQAFATIAVLSGSDASARLPGFHRGTRTAQITETVRGVQLITRGATLLDTLMVSHYDDRGWTMQERILSRRCLFFSDFQVFFQCQKSIRHEIDESSSIPRQTFHDLHVLNPLIPLQVGGLMKSNLRVLDDRNASRWSKFISFAMKYVMDVLPSESTQESLDLISEPPHSWIFGFEFYATLVESYTRRNLSYASDVLNAFEGLSSIMEQCCGSSFYYGLPESLFDIVVLWAPCSSIHFDRRRMYRPSRANEDLRRGITVTEFPSWSWAGWIGEVEYNPLLSPIVTPSEHRTNRMLKLTETAVKLIQPEVESFIVHSRQGFRAINRNMQFFQPVALDLLAERTEKRKIFDIPAEPGVLYFVASCTYASSFSVSDNPTRKSELLVHDFYGRPCGKLFSGQELLCSEPRTAELRYALLSRVRYPQSKYPNTRHSVNNDILNVLLIRTSGHYSERIGIGQIVESAWLTSKPEKKLIRLV